MTVQFHKMTQQKKQGHDKAKLKQIQNRNRPGLILSLYGTLFYALFDQLQYFVHLYHCTITFQIKNSTSYFIVVVLPEKYHRENVHIVLNLQPGVYIRKESFRSYSYSAHTHLILCAVP